MTALSVEFSNALKIFNLEKIFNSDNLDKPNMVVGVLGSCHFWGPRFQDAGAVLAMCRIGGRCGVVSWSLSCKRGETGSCSKFFFLRSSKVDARERRESLCVSCLGQGQAGLVAIPTCLGRAEPGSMRSLGQGWITSRMRSMRRESRRI